MTAHSLTKKVNAAILWMAVATFPAQGYQYDHDPAAQEIEQAIHLTPNLEKGRKAYFVCAVCHLPEGWGTPDGRYPQIAGQLSSVTIKQLADIRARNRDNPTMLPFTSKQEFGGLQEIANVAAYIAQLPMNPKNRVGAGSDLAFGKELYEENCLDCHGENGEGDKKKHIPLVQGQNIMYLTRQFEWIKDGRRRNSHKEMVEQIKNFSQREEAAVLDYVSRLKPPKEKLAEPGWLNPDFPNFSRYP